MLKDTKISPFYGDIDHHSLKKIITFTILTDAGEWIINYEERNVKHRI